MLPRTQLLCLAATLLACGSGSATPGDGGPAVPVDAEPLPTVLCSIELNCEQSIPDEPKVPCEIRVEDGYGGVEYLGAAGVELRGRSSQSFAKPQYAIELRASASDETERPTNLFSMGRESDWVLNGAYVDRALVRNRLLFDLFQSFGGPERYAAQIRYCGLTLDGDNRGIYMLSERVKRDDDRVSIAEDTALDGRSFLLKQDESGGIRDVEIANGQWRMVYPRGLNATSSQIAGVNAWLDSWIAVVSGVDTVTDLFSLVDLESAVDFVLLEEFAKNNDAYFLSMHIWKTEGGLLHFTPWDLDLSFGQPNYNNSESPEGWIQYRPPLVAFMSAQSVFSLRLSSRWRELRAGVMTAESIMARIDSYMEVIGPHIESNFQRWPIEDIQFLGDTLYPIASHAEELAKVRAWIRMRLEWMDANIDAY